MTGLFSWPPEDLDPEDIIRIRRIEAELYRIAGSADEFVEQMVGLVRLAIDEVIDTGRSGRFSFSELETTEKAYIGVRTEILFRSAFSLERGKLDVVIAGEDVDIKNTTSGTWMIPTHSVGKPCLLIKSEPRSDPGTCSAGLAFAHIRYLNHGANQDKKKTFKAAHLDKILWLFRDETFPTNVLDGLSEKDKRLILGASSGSERVANLFRRLQRIPIPRHVIEAVARQTDPAKRIRRNGGARDLTEPEGLFILSYDQQRRWLDKLPLPQCAKGDFISIRPETEIEKLVIAEMLKANG